MSKCLEALERLKNTLLAEGYWQDVLQDVAIVEKELKDRDNALKTISDIIRDFNTGEFASAEAALKEITEILSEVLP